MTKEELGELIMQEQESFYRIAKTIIYEDADVSDALSETIVRAFASLHQLRHDRYAKTWFVRILLNECYKTLKSRNRLIYMEEAELISGEGSADDRDYSELYICLEQLPEETRLCIVLYYMEDYSVKEVAKLLDTTASSVKNRLLRGRKRLKELLDVPVEQLA